MTLPSNPSITVENLSKTYALAEPGGGHVSLLAALRTGRREAITREVHALRNVSFRIGLGERVGIIGRNGAGKTTLLSILAGITDPSAGSISIAGDIHAMLTIGAVLRDEATGRENIYLDGEVHGKSHTDIEAQLDEIIAFSELGEFIDRPVRTYSSGMKARLAFSMGAFIEPDILIIDETLSVGDVFFAEKASRRMKEIAAQGRIVIVVSHSLATIVDMCERCLWLDKGQLVMDGPAAEVTKAYETSVDQADEAELSAKFGRGELPARQPALGSLTAMQMLQDGRDIGARALAFIPLNLVAHGMVTGLSPDADLVVSIIRVDGRRIFRRSLRASGGELPRSGVFRTQLEFDPLLLAAGLYRVDLALLCNEEPIDMMSRVLEILDEAGQFGGQPMLYSPPIMKAERIGNLE